MNTPYLSREDLIPVSTFLGGDCGFDRVYLNGLAPGSLLISHSPYMIVNSNGVLAGVDERFTRFEVVNQGITENIVTLNWKTDCANQPPALTPMTSGISELPVPIILMIVSVVYLAILRRIRR
jgi:hypothetical protein